MTLLSIVLISTLIVLWKFQSKAETETKPEKIVLKSSVDIWSDTLIYWADVSTISLQKSWECTDPDCHNKHFELYQKADSIYFNLLDTCESKLSDNDYSMVVNKVVTNQIHI